MVSAPAVWTAAATEAAISSHDTACMTPSARWAGGSSRVGASTSPKP